MAKTLMIQGTMSNVGKSLLTAGLLRIMKEDGFRAAPFKSQNMALNSYITEEGLEMGRAQAVQAEAAGIQPTVDMNPVLLKPITDAGSQVIVGGIHQGNMPAKEYFSYKKTLIPDILAAFHRLEQEYELIVIEGAGSPAEINLKQEDIVNMGLAQMVDAPVLLVGDIDRGGVFAQLYGTVMLLEKEERKRIQGLIINKFRGDKTILDPGVTMIEDLCNIPVVGVTPYMEVDLEDEDSLGVHLEGSRQNGLVEIAVIQFPRISNFTDFQVFGSMPEVSLRYVKRMGELGNPDMIILPGTKNTIDDLLWMQKQGLEAQVLKMAASGTPIFGICGGYQMMGNILHDPKHLESTSEICRGMGLLQTDTIFQEEKKKTRVRGTFGRISGILAGLSGTAVEGYEIHMGVTVKKQEEPALTYVTEWQAQEESSISQDEKIQKPDGSFRNHCYGTYLHGIFDAKGVAEKVVQALMEQKGISRKLGISVDYQVYKEAQYQKLAKELRKYLDMDRIYKIMGVKK